MNTKEQRDALVQDMREWEWVPRIKGWADRLAAMPVSDAEPYGHHHYQSQFEQRANERMAQAYPTLAAFFSKYAIGPKVEASCFACGHTGERSITHLELPGVYVCETCVSKIRAAPPALPDGRVAVPVEPTPKMQVAWACCAGIWADRYAALIAARPEAK